MRRRHTEIALALAALALGAAIYLLFRTQELVGFHVAEALGLGGVVDALRNMAQSSRPSDFVVYCLPNGLWSAAYVLLIDSTQRSASIGQRMATAAVVPALGVTSEFMQLAGAIPGTFDPLDNLCYALPYVFYVIYKTPEICLKRNQKSENLI